MPTHHPLHTGVGFGPSAVPAAQNAFADCDALLVVNDGKHTFLAAELFPVHRPRGFIPPTDFNCMGYCVPAAVGAKLAHPERQVAAIVRDGAFLMTAMELLTAAAHDLGVMAFVFHDGELGQISQFQSIPPQPQDLHAVERGEDRGRGRGHRRPLRSHGDGRRH